MVSEDLRAPDGNLSQKLRKIMTWGDQALVSKARNFIFNRGFYTKLHIENNRGYEIMQSQQSLILIETRVSFLQTYRIQMV